MNVGVGWGVGMIRMGTPFSNALDLPGTSVNYASTPDSPANSISGDIDMLARIAAADWTPSPDQALMAKVNPLGATSWGFYILGTGALYFQFDTSATGGFSATSTVGTGFANGSDHWVRVTRRVSDGRVQFFTSSDGASWTQLGTDAIAGVGATIFDTNAPVTIGARGDGGVPFAGIVYYAELRDGIGGTVIHSFDPAAVTKIGIRNPATVAAGGPWTMVGSTWDWVAA